MSFCGSCGTQVQEGVKFCPACGTAIQPAGNTGAVSTQPEQQTTEQKTVTAQNDAEANKVMAIVSYILFFIPAITGDYKKSPFVKYHLNQGTVLFVIAVAYGIVSAILKAVIKVREDYGWGIYYTHTPSWLTTILWIGNLCISALCIYGIYNAATGKLKHLPIIGDKFTIWK